MGRLLTVGSVIFAGSALIVYQLWPSLPEGLENKNLQSHMLNAVGTLMFKMLVIAEEFKWINCSAKAMRSIIDNSPKKEIEAMRLPNVEVQNTTIADVPVLIFRPSSSQDSNNPKAAVVYFHGGGFIFGSARDSFPWTQYLAVNSDVVIISVDYRLAPEHPFPAGVDDCVKVTKAIFDDAKRLIVDSRRILVGGDSAGANLAAVVAVELAESPTYKLKGQVLVSPALQALNMASLPSYKKYGSLFGFPVAWMISKYAGVPYSRTINSAMLNNQHVKRSDLVCI